MNVLLNNQKGQGMVETMIVTVLFLSTVIFAMVQFSMISFGWFRANEAAFSAVRCAVVAKQKPKQSAEFAASYILGTAMPAQTTVWTKTPNGAGKDHSGIKLKMMSAHIYYVQKLMFASILQPLSEGGSFYGGGIENLDVSRKRDVRGSAHARMIKSPDSKFYEGAYSLKDDDGNEVLKKFDE